MSKQISVGDFISIPVWKVTGQVIEIKAATTGSDAAQQVLVQEEPEAHGVWFNLEPGQFTFENEPTETFTVKLELTVGDVEACNAEHAAEFVQDMIKEMLGEHFLEFKGIKVANVKIAAGVK